MASVLVISEGDEEQDDCTSSNSGDFVNVSNHAILDGNFFKVIKSESNGSIKAKCVLCNNSKILSANVNATGNLKLHFRRRHPNAMKELEEHIRSFRVNARKNDTTDRGRKRKEKQTKISDTFSRQKITQEKLNNLIMSFVAEGMHPLSTVEQPKFIALIKCLAPELSVISRRTLQRHLEDTFLKRNDSLRQLLTKQVYLCITADIWSACNRSYMGVTVHFLVPETLERKSFGLCCRRFRGSHTSDKVAELLDEILNDFHISRRSLVAAVTDNGSNFIKAFKNTGITIDTINASNDDDPTGDDVTGDNIDFQKIESIESGNLFCPLPFHVRCSCHTLSLVAVKDADNGLKASPTVSRIHRSMMSKCSDLWKASKRPKAEEMFSKILGCMLKTPCETRWNSLYDSLHDLLCEKNKEKIPDLMNQLSLKGFTETEWLYMTEYASVLAPIAGALMYLQGEKMSFYGDLLPTLFATRQKLQNLDSQGQLTYCSSILTAVLMGLEKRYCNVFNLNLQDTTTEIMFLATCSHPKYKFRWLSNANVNDSSHLSTLFISKVRELYEMSESRQSTFEETVLSTAGTSYDSFVDEFLNTATNNTTQSNLLEMEVLNFLEDRNTGLHTINGYPNVKRVFLKYNTILSSSAPVERLFSFAGLVFRSNRRRLSDATFEQCLLLREGLEIF